MARAPKVFKPARRPAPVRRRKTTTERGYGSEHQRQRERLLKERPLCQLCGKAWSTDLHHIDRNPFNRADDNALMVCEPCHHTKIHGR